MGWDPGWDRGAGSKDRSRKSPGCRAESQSSLNQSPHFNAITPEPELLGWCLADGNTEAPGLAQASITLFTEAPLPGASSPISSQFWRFSSRVLSPKIPWVGLTILNMGCLLPNIFSRHHQCTCLGLAPLIRQKFCL